MVFTFFEDPQLQKFFLILARVSGLLVFAPPFFNRRLALQLKGGIAFFLAIVLFPNVKEAGVVVPATFPELGLAMLFELLIGFIIGFGIQMLFAAFQIAGEIIDRQIGFAMASLVDPQTDMTVSILGTVLQNLGLFIFLSWDGHLWLIRTFAGSFHSMPLLDMNIQVDGLAYHMTGLLTSCMKFAVEFSIPVIIIMMMVHIAQGFLMRTIPQLNIFVVGFIFTLVIGSLSVRILIQQFTHASEGLIDSFEQEIWFIITHLRNG